MDDLFAHEILLMDQICCSGCRWPWRRRLTVKLGRFAADSRTRPGPARGPIRAATAIPSGAGSLLGHRIPRKRALPRGPYLTHERQAPYRHHLFLLRAASVIARSEEHTSELQSLIRISYAVF